MANTCVIGLQWGDEGKGKIIDILAKDYDIIARYQGGGNAGHTLIIGDEKFVFHLIPSGILHQDKTCVIGNGVVFDPSLFLEEINGLAKKNINVTGNLFISDRAHVVFPYHKKLDLLMEKQKGNSMIGTTGRGIGPCYTDKVSRDGIRVAELLDKERFKEKLKKNVEEKTRIFVNLYNNDEPVSWEDIYEEYCEYADKIAPFVCDTVDLMARAINDNKKILFEGAQGALLDIDFGTYPFTTSSNSGAGGVSSGTGVSPKQIHNIIGITKAYTTRVGSGPFPSEVEGEQGEHIRKKGGEFGSTTGRPRRCGWFDAVAIQHSVRISGVDSLIVTKLDVLDDQETIRICTGYKCNEKSYNTFPADIDVLNNCEPVYDEVSGWCEDTSKVRSAENLPEKAWNYIKTIENIVGVRVGMVSVGPERSQIISI
ncbi:MAG: adenylosuccinate synthase [Candidatus Scalindua rubra]|nr:adenylosuccinate synthase [Candidatus Scalindua rubra]